MTPPLFLVDGPLPADGTVDLLGEEGRHAARVRRLSVGELLELSDGHGAVCTGTVVEVLPDGLRVAVSDLRVDPVPTVRVVVVQALAKGDRGELAVETMTELGVDAIVPWSASRAVVRWQGARGERSLERWRSTAREAAKQSRRARVPEIAELATTAAVAARLPAAAGSLVLHETADEPLSTVPLPLSGDLVIVVGPEGGVSDDELDTFAEAGAHPVHLGRPVLRTSTAGAAALAALSLRLGRWS